MIRALVLLLAIALTACSATPSKREPSPPLPAQCEARCLTPCDTTRPRWNVDPADPQAWDRLGDQVIAPLLDKLDACELHRLSCEQCLRRADRAGVITLGEPSK